MIYSCIIIFISQLLFVFLRTWNVKTIATNNMIMTIISGILLHIIWLISTALGVKSILLITTDWNNIFILLSSTIGGILGTYLAMKK